MGHEYPLEVNWNSTRFDTLMAHGLSLLLVVGAVTCSFLSKRWAAKQPIVSVWVWALAMVGAPIAVYLLSARLDPNTKTAAEPFMISYVVIFWLAAFPECGPRINASNNRATIHHLNSLWHASSYSAAASFWHYRPA